MSQRSSCFAEAIEQARVDVVPQIVVGSGSGNGATSGSSLMEGLLAMLLSERMGTAVGGSSNGPAGPEAEALRTQIRQSLAANKSQDELPARPAPGT